MLKGQYDYVSKRYPRGTKVEDIVRLEGPQITRKYPQQNHSPMLIHIAQYSLDPDDIRLMASMMMPLGEAIDEQYLIMRSDRPQLFKWLLLSQLYTQQARLSMHNVILGQGICWQDSIAIMGADQCIISPKECNAAGSASHALTLLRTEIQSNPNWRWFWPLFGPRESWHQAQLEMSRLAQLGYLVGDGRAGRELKELNGELSTVGKPSTDPWKLWEELFPHLPLGSTLK